MTEIYQKPSRKHLILLNVIDPTRLEWQNCITDDHIYRNDELTVENNCLLVRYVHPQLITK